MTTDGLYPNKIFTDQLAKVAFYLLVDPATAVGDNNIKYYATPFETRDTGAHLVERCDR
jgi:hypothetical protein